MEMIKSLFESDTSNVSLYLLKRRNKKDEFDATIFPNDINDSINSTYKSNVINFIKDRPIVEYDAVHSEKKHHKKTKDIRGAVLDKNADCY